MHDRRARRKMNRQAVAVAYAVALEHGPPDGVSVRVITDLNSPIVTIGTHVRCPRCKGKGTVGPDRFYCFLCEGHGTLYPNSVRTRRKRRERGAFA